MRLVATRSAQFIVRAFAAGETEFQNKEQFDNSAFTESRVHINPRGYRELLGQTQTFISSDGWVRTKSIGRCDVSAGAIHRS
jgi:hypothetical protein